MMNKRRVAMVIAGSDSIASAGIQRDIKTFHEIGVLATTVITCITAQNTSSIRAIQDISVDLIQQQIDAIMDECNVTTLKTGMLYTDKIAHVVYEFVCINPDIRLILDPVMIATSGVKILNDDAICALTELISKAYVVTPNANEAEILAKMSIQTQHDVENACLIIHSLGVKNVIIKGGHLDQGGDFIINTLFDGKKFHRFAHPRIKNCEFHGSGCMFASALSAYLFQNRNDLVSSVEMASDFTYKSIRSHYLGDHNITV